jgi:hypothetical protein
MSFLSSLKALFWDEEKNLPTVLFWILCVFILSIITYLIVAYIYGRKAPSDLAPTAIQLNTATTLVQDGRSLMISPGFTIAGFFNVTMGDRTRSKDTNYTTLIGIPNCVEFQLAPATTNPTNTGASPNQYSARLLISTGNNNPTEVVNLPPMPMQKWIFVCLLRDGRRFDVLYNDQIVGSHRLTNYPNTSTAQPLQVSPDAKPKAKGVPRFIGTAVHIFTQLYRMTPSELAVLRAQNSDTTGAPPEPLSFPLPSLFSLPNMRTFCLPGLPCTVPTQPPSNTMQMWETIYN